MKYALMMMSLFIFIACSDPRDTVIPANPDEWETNEELKQAVQKLSDKEKELVAGYAVRLALAKSFNKDAKVQDITISQAINIQREWEKEKETEAKQQEELAENLQQKQLEVFKSMNGVLTVTLVKLDFIDGDKRYTFDDKFSIEVGFKNNSDKDIMGAKGIVVLKDIFGDVIKQIQLANDTGIEANQTAVWSGTMDYNNYSDEDVKLRTTEFEKIKFEWLPGVYIFADGTKMEMPQN